jgi:hypothetical protein
MYRLEESIGNQSLKCSKCGKKVMEFMMFVTVFLLINDQKSEVSFLEYGLFCTVILEKDHLIENNYLQKLGMKTNVLTTIIMTCG